MITIGLGKLVLDRRNTSSADSHQPSPAALQALSETAAWCSSRALQGDQLRSRELDPSAFIAPPYSPPYEKDNFKIWLETKRDGYQRAIQAINERRSALLQKGNVEQVPIALAQSKGKLLLYEPLETVEDGAAESSSSGFFDLEDAPPWDTWFLYSGGTIFSWVPEALVQNAQAGIEVNPVDCIRWCDWSKLAKLRDL